MTTIERVRAELKAEKRTEPFCDSMLCRMLCENVLQFLDALAAEEKGVLEALEEWGGERWSDFASRRDKYKNEGDDEAADEWHFRNCESAEWLAKLHELRGESKD